MKGTNLVVLKRMMGGKSVVNERWGLKGGLGFCLCGENETIITKNNSEWKGCCVNCDRDCSSHGTWLVGFVEGCGGEGGLKLITKK